MFFPDEIVEKILYQCDGQTLIQCAQTCKRFNQIAGNISRSQSFWFNCVQQEIEPDIVKDILGRKSISYVDQLYQDRGGDGQRLIVNGDEEDEDGQDEDDESDDDSRLTINAFKRDPWFTIYKKWIHGKTFNLRTTIKQNVSGFINNPVGCLKISGDVIILGHRDGSVSICDYLSNQIQIAFRHDRMVTDIGLVNLTSKSSFHYSEQSKLQHHHIISISKDKTICAYPMIPLGASPEEAKTGAKPAPIELESLRIFGNRCAVYAQNSQISLWKLSLPPKGVDNLFELDQPLGLDFLQVITGREELFGWMNFWEDSIVTICGLTTRSNFYDLKRSSWTRQNTLQLPSTFNHPTILTHSSDRGLPSSINVKISRVFIFRESIIFLISATGRIFYSLDHQHLQTFGAHEDFNAKVSSMALWGSILAFGLENGQLIVYNCPKTADIETLDASQPKYRRHIAPERGNEAIVCLDIGDYGRGPIISAATLFNVSIFKWFFQ